MLGRVVVRGGAEVGMVLVWPASAEEQGWAFSALAVPVAFMSSPVSNSHNPRARIFAVLGGVFLSLLVLEFGYRGLAFIGWLPKSWAPSEVRRETFRDHVASDVRGMFEPKAFVGYALRGESINSEGFSDREWPLKRTPGVPRIACLGGSTTQDGHREDRDNTYTSYLSRMLSRRLKKEVEVLNFGVNGWTSAESLVNYALVVSHYQPDVVVVHHSVNDVWPRLYPDYRRDYTHYRVPWYDAEMSWWDRALVQYSRLWAAWRIQDEDLTGVRERVIRRVDGEPVPILSKLEPETTAGYRGNIEHLCRLIRADGGVPVLMTMPFSAGGGGFERKWVGLVEQGTREHNAIMREVAAAEDALLVDAALTFSSAPAEHEKFFQDYVHLRPAGNRVKALGIADAVQGAKALK